MLAHEAQEGMEAGMFGGDLVGCGLDDRRDLIAKLFAHVANERLGDFLLRLDIGVEAAASRAGTAGDRAARCCLHTTLDGLALSGNKPIAQGTPPAPCARGCVASACSGRVMGA